MKVSIVYKSVLKEFTDIEERNYTFNNLDAQSQRLEIAWDALQIIFTGKVNTNKAGYWSQDLLSIRGNSKELQFELVNNLPQCQVCQRGLMMLCQIRLGNSIDSQDVSKYDGQKENIKGFTINDFLNMEDEYEYSTYYHPYRTNTDEKLANICCNVLVNGNFNTEDQTNYLCN